MADPAQGLSVVVSDDEAEPVRIDPVTGTVEHDQADGSVIVELDKARKGREAGKFDANLAEKMDENELSRIGNELHQAISDDHESRGNWLEIRARLIDFCGLQIKEPRANVGDTSAAVEGMATVTNPLLLEGILKGWANAQAELLPSEGPAKVDEQDHETPQSDELAEALERDFNYYLTVTATEYYPDTSHMLLWGVYLGGSGFKKIYRCPMRRRPVSESVSPENLIVSDTMKDMRSCARLTHQIEMRPSVMQRMKLLGAYRDTPATTPSPLTATAVTQAVAGVQGTNPSPHTKRDADRPYTLWESQCELDLPDYAPGKFKGESIPLPYLVTLDKDSREVLAIRRDWNEDDEDAQRKRLYVKYPYVPGPGFYGTGLGHILGNCSAAMTAAWREALDAGMFANFPAFLMAKLGGRQNTSDFRLSAGTGASIETNGMPIGNIVSNLPYRDVTPGLLSLIDKITSQAKELGGVADIPASEGVANVPVGTMLASIEQATKVMAAAHKGMHQAQAEELQMLVDLFRDHPEDFWQQNKKCPQGFWDEAKFRQALQNCSLVPRSDPNTPSHIHRVAKALALVQMLNSPALAQVMSAKEVALRALAVLREDPTNLIVDPQPQPGGAQQGPAADPLIGQARMLSAQAQVEKVKQEGVQDQVKTQLDQSKLQVQKDIATSQLAREFVIHRGDQAKEAAAQQHAQHEADREHGLGTAQYGLDVARLSHERQQADREHALNVHEAMNPPEPAAAKPKKRAAGGRVEADGGGLTEAIRDWIKAMTAPRVITRDERGRLTGVRMDMPAESAPPVVESDGSLIVQIEDE